MDELEAVYLRLREIEVEGVAVIKLRVNNGGGDGTSCFKIKIHMTKYITDALHSLIITWSCMNLKTMSIYFRFSSPLGLCPQ